MSVYLLPRLHSATFPPRVHRQNAYAVPYLLLGLGCDFGLVNFLQIDDLSMHQTQFVNVEPALLEHAATIPYPVCTFFCSAKKTGLCIMMESLQSGCGMLFVVPYLAAYCSSYVTPA
jgi:hypothetical protein